MPDKYATDLFRLSSLNIFSMLTPVLKNQSNIGGMKPRFQVIPAVYVALLRNEGKQVLLGKRINTGYADGLLGLPSGHLEEGESLTEAARREAKEETGIEINAGDLHLFHTQWRESIPSNPGTRIDFFFKCSKWSGDVRNMEPTKCSGWDWFSLDKLDSSVIAPVKLALDGGLSRNVNLLELNSEERRKIE